MARRKNWLASSLIALMRLHYQQGHSIKELARVYRVHPSVAANICHGRTHRRVVAPTPLMVSAWRMWQGAWESRRGLRRKKAAVAALP